MDFPKEQPVRIPDFDEPEPDIAIVRGGDDDYEHRHPGPADVGLLVEVSESHARSRPEREAPGLCQEQHPRLLDRQPG